MPSVKLPEKQLTELRAFVTLVRGQPSILHQPDMQFLKQFIESFGGVIPPEDKSDAPPKKCPAQEKPKAATPPPATEEPELVESDLELDQTGVLEPDNDAPQEMGSAADQELTEEDEDKLCSIKQEAVAAFADGDYSKAVSHFTEAIKMNSSSALMFAKRANCYIHLKKPNACIRDCDRALEINPDSAAARKYRGRALRLLGKWEEAAQDLRLACKIDYDDQANEWLKEVTPNAKKLEEHRRKYERLREEKLLREKQERIRRAQEEHKKASERQNSGARSAPGGGFGGMGGGNPFGGMGGMGGGAGGMPDIGSLLNDPEVLAAFQDPEVAQAFQDVSSNPANYAKYENNPKIKSVINKMAGKFGGGMPGMPGGMGGFPPGFSTDDFPGSGEDPYADMPDLD